MQYVFIGGNKTVLGFIILFEKYLGLPKNIAKPDFQLFSSFFRLVTIIISLLELMARDW
jgi:hypothetical protein